MLGLIRKKYPGAALHWVTQAPAEELLKGHPFIDHVYTTSHEDLLRAQAFDFEVSLCVDKSLTSSAIAKLLAARTRFGFYADPITGSILPQNPEAQELWEIGLDDKKKFYENKKSELQLQIEALKLGPSPSAEYSLPLTVKENLRARERRHLWTQVSNQPVIGINTGCSATLPAKKWSVAFHQELLDALQKKGYKNLVLLGGGVEDQNRNLEIGRNRDVTQSPTALGLRDGLISVEACDIVISGDSLGMHLAIARQKFVIAWFGPTCAHEIDLFGRGVALKSALPCSPCWKKSCDQIKMCYDSFQTEQVLEAIKAGETWFKNQPPSSSIKPPFSETSSSLSLF
jgi:heptosyltransferase-2